MLPSEPPARLRKPGEPFDCSENETARAGYPKRVTAVFRTYAQSVDGLYAVAVNQFGSPQSCAVLAEPIDASVQVENPDAASFLGTLRYSFPNGATLLYVNETSLDETLTSLSGFTDENAARLGLEKAAGFALKKGKIEKADTDDVIVEPPEQRPTGSRTVIWSDDRVGGGQQNTYAEMTYLAKRLISLRSHK